MKISGYILLILGIMGAFGGLTRGDFSAAGIEALVMYIIFIPLGSYLIKKARIKKSDTPLE